MYVRSRKVKGNQYFYLVASERVEGKPNPVQRVIQYLGNQEAAIAKLESSDYPDKDKLLERVRGFVPVVGKNQGARGRPKESDRGDFSEIPPGKVADIV